MAGTLAEELRGRLADEPAVHRAVVEAGKAFGLERRASRSYGVNNVKHAALKRQGRRRHQCA